LIICQQHALQQSPRIDHISSKETTFDLPGWAAHLPANGDCIAGGAHDGKGKTLMAVYGDNEQRPQQD